MSRGHDIPQRGKYRLNLIEEWVLLALEARGPQTVNGMFAGHGPRPDLGWPFNDRKSEARDVMRRALLQLERKGLVRRVQISAARLMWRLTDEGHVDAAARLRALVREAEHAA